MLTHATCDATGVYCYQDQEPQTEEPREVLILIPQQSKPEISFTVPISPWQGNGS